MKKTLVALLLLTTATSPAWAEDLLAVTPGAGSNIGGRLATGGGFHAGPMSCDATDPRICAPVSASTGVVTSNLALGALADTAGDGVNASAVSLLHQLSLNTKASVSAIGSPSITGAGTMQGPVATGSAQAANPLPGGLRAATAEPPAVADGQAVLAKGTKAGAAVTVPWTTPEMWLRATATVTNAPATLMPASGSASQYSYITSMECGNSSANGVWASLNDGASSYVYIPAGGGNNPHFEPPLVSALNTAITITGSSTETTVRCAVQGFKGL